MLSSCPHMHAMPRCGLNPPYPLAQLMEMIKCPIPSFRVSPQRTCVTGTSAGAALDTLNYSMQAPLPLLLKWHISAAVDCRCRAVFHCRFQNRLRRTALLMTAGVDSAGCMFDSVGGEVQTFYGWEASLVINTSTVSNTLQRNSFIEYDAADAAFRFSGVVALSGQSASVTVLVCRPPSTLQTGFANGLQFAGSTSAPSGRRAALTRRHSTA